MCRRNRVAIFLILACAVSGQITAESPSSDDTLVWQPPTLQFPETLPPPTVSREMITALRVGGVPVVFEETSMIDVQKRVGGAIGKRGDASDYVEWLCFNGSDVGGRWALWLESSELGGELIDAFALQRLGRSAKSDPRCRFLPEGDGGVDLPIALRLGMTEIQVRQILGRPTLTYHGTLIFFHERKQIIRNEPYTASNIVSIVIREGVVWAIHASKDTVN
jgi:hypothetical protein